MYRAKVEELEDEQNAVHREVSFEVRLCLKNAPSDVYGGGERSALKVKKVDSENRKLSSSIISTEKKKKKTATPNGGGEENGVRGAET